MLAGRVSPRGDWALFQRVATLLSASEIQMSKSFFPPPHKASEGRPPSHKAAAQRVSSAQGFWSQASSVSASAAKALADGWRDGPMRHLAHGEMIHLVFTV